VNGQDRSARTQHPSVAVKLAPVPAPARGGHPAHELILHAQRTAGNQAVARALAPRPAPRMLARALVGFGVQAHVAERPSGTDDPPATVVASIDIGGRPQGLFGAAHRSHTTAWVTYGDVVRTAILNQELPVAIQRMQTLIDEAKALPGADDARLTAMRDDIQVTGREAEKTGRQIYDAAEGMATTASGNVTTHGATPGRGVDLLQDLIEAYLTLRNATPLSVTYDVTSAGGHGEGSTRGQLSDRSEKAAAASEAEREGVADTLKEVEAGQRQADKDTVRGLLWKLFDRKAAVYLVTTEPDVGRREHSTVPGNVPGETPAKRIADVVAQHLLTIRRAYPELYRLADMDAEDSLRDMLGPDADTLVAPGGATVLARVAGFLGRPVADMPRGDPVGVVPPEHVKGTAQLKVGDRGGTPIVSQVLVGERPTGILGADEGAHVTAFGLAVQGLKRRLEGQPLAWIPAALVQLKDDARALPTVRRAGELAGEPATHHARADSAMEEAVERAGRTPFENPGYVAVLQEAIVAYLRYRNTLPLAATLEGGVPGGKAEGGALGHLRRAENQDPADDELDQRALDAAWRLVDSAALRAISESISKLRAPGISRDGDARRERLTRVGDAVGTHVLSVQQAFPKVTGRTGIATKAGVTRFLSGELPRATMTDADEDRVEGALQLADDDVAAVAEYVMTGVLPDPAPEEAMTARRSSRPRNDKRKQERLDEEEFNRVLEEAEEDESANIDRSGAKKQRGSRGKKIVTQT
jgi:hypothetical protein